MTHGAKLRRRDGGAEGIPEVELDRAEGCDFLGTGITPFRTRAGSLWEMGVARERVREEKFAGH